MSRPASDAEINALVGMHKTVQQIAKHGSSMATHYFKEFEYSSRPPVDWRAAHDQKLWLAFFDLANDAIVLDKLLAELIDDSIRHREDKGKEPV